MSGRHTTNAWYADRRYLLAGAITLNAIWGVECLRKGDLIWPWPLVPLAIWAALLLAMRRPAGTNPRLPS